MDIEQRVIAALDAAGADYRLMECDPELADTAAFCEHYGVALEDSANSILVMSKRPAGQVALCLVLATDRLDVNRRVRDAMGVKKLSFASADITAEHTGMLIGGVTPFGAEGIPLLVDRKVMDRPRVVIGGGSRSMKVDVDPEVFGRLPNARILDLAMEPAPSD